MTSSFSFSHQGYCDICERAVSFDAKFAWFRDHLLCSGCGSIPRERALMAVLRQYFPKYKSLAIHESSPGARGVSAKLARECKRYTYSHFFPGTALGTIHPERNERCESLEALSFPDRSFDLVITQDVIEHLLDPDAAFQEISRVLKPGGAHVFTVPLVNKEKPTVRRAEHDENGHVSFLQPPQYHGNPIDERGALVTFDWGYDIQSFIRKSSSMATHMITIDDVDRGIQAEYIEVLVSFKR
ncbi:class I SAM-dependent methyltransferase [Hyphomonas chukchiensis]|uniref:class I SAM-dependent methyltransferase n=1 Tax=Hyphomonas chukchiensis TaxID=1280947 RepID=UPI0030FC48FC|tara:strand:- start:7248 stop:7973 length:726 start_codon:yes stop_codon:yes gene_type:complete